MYLYLRSSGIIQCDCCSRVVPIAPGGDTTPDGPNEATVPHVFVRQGNTFVPCSGNKDRRYRNSTVDLSRRLAQQYAILDDDAYWEGV